MRFWAAATEKKSLLFVAKRVPCFASSEDPFCFLSTRGINPELVNGMKSYYNLIS
jgi:hypothetical protein